MDKVDEQKLKSFRSTFYPKVEVEGLKFGPVEDSEVPKYVKFIPQSQAHFPSMRSPVKPLFRPVEEKRKKEKKIRVKPVGKRYRKELSRIMNAKHNDDDGYGIGGKVLKYDEDPVTSINTTYGKKS
ncbi:MAG: hypothetical protein GTN76_06905 [Candidatus Aenigmarchaeota archaeon]|nr:hypothetical protein [Candidatus Aenigmarchaeota archaeon]